MFCDRCGKKLPDNARFCDACGNRIQLIYQTPAAAPAVAPEPAEEAAAVAVMVEETAPAEAVAEAVQQPAEETAPLETVAEEPQLPEEVPAEEIPAEEVPAEEVPIEEVPAEAVPEEAEPQPVVVPVSQPAEQPVPVLKPVPARRKPHIGLRIPMQLLSFVLCLLLIASLLATVALADLNRMTSAGGIKQLIQAVLVPNPAPSAVRPVGAAGIHGLSADLGDVDISQIPTDIFTGEDPNAALVEWLMEMAKEALGEELPVTKEQVQNVVEQSTITDFLAEKVASYTQDYINGTENTTITAEEIMDLIEENEELLERELDIKLSAQDKQMLKVEMELAIEEADLDRVVRDEVFASVDQAIEDSTASMGNVDREDVMVAVQTVTSTTTLLVAIGVCVLLMLLLFALNFYNLPAGLTWISGSCLFAGLILSLPVALLQIAPDMVRSWLDLDAAVMAMLSGFVGVMAPFHYGLLGLGVVLLVLSIVWRKLRSNRANKRSMAAV